MKRNEQPGLSPSKRSRCDPSHFADIPLDIHLIIAYYCVSSLLTKEPFTEIIKKRTIGSVELEPDLSESKYVPARNYNFSVCEFSVGKDMTPGLVTLKFPDRDLLMCCISDLADFLNYSSAAKGLRQTLLEIMVEMQMYFSSYFIGSKENLSRCKLPVSDFLFSKDDLVSLSHPGVSISNNFKDLLSFGSCLKKVVLVSPPGLELGIWSYLSDQGISMFPGRCASDKLETVIITTDAALYCSKNQSNAPMQYGKSELVPESSFGPLPTQPTMSLKMFVKDFSDFKNLKTLHLKGNFRAKSLLAIGNAPNLQELKITLMYDCRMQVKPSCRKLYRDFRESWDVLSKKKAVSLFSKLQRLEVLKIREQRSGLNGKTFVYSAVYPYKKGRKGNRMCMCDEVLGVLTNLKTLCIRDHGIEPFIQDSCSVQIRECAGEFPGAFVTDEGLSKLTKLRNLDISGSKSISGSCFTKLLKLETLSIGESWVRSEFVANLAGLEHLYGLLAECANGADDQMILLRGTQKTRDTWLSLMSSRSISHLAVDLDFVLLQEIARGESPFVALSYLQLNLMSPGSHVVTEDNLAEFVEVLMLAINKLENLNSLGIGGEARDGAYLLLEIQFEPKTQLSKVPLSLLEANIVSTMKRFNLD